MLSESLFHFQGISLFFSVKFTNNLISVFVRNHVCDGLEIGSEKNQSFVHQFYLQLRPSLAVIFFLSLFLFDFFLFFLNDFLQRQHIINKNAALRRTTDKFVVSSAMLSKHSPRLRLCPALFPASGGRSHSKFPKNQTPLFLLKLPKTCLDTASALTCKFSSILLEETTLV